TAFISVFALIFIGSISTAANDTIEKTFDVQPGGLLSVESELGSIEVESGSSNKVDITIIRKTDTWSEEENKKLLKDFEVNFSQDGNNVNVEAKYKR
ncbi:MAG: hypothetical protein GWN59_06445, partial [Calditrichae bacterium]|nr:hypothetical protein [Calditrichia bacterium]NIV72692.1 hypothetical protein [Calditrichia bacterium]